MKKQQTRQLSRNKPQSQPLKANPATTSKHVQGEASGISSDGAVELIRAQAYRLFELRGQQPGHALEDWLLAEREVLQSAASGNKGCTCTL